MVEPTISPYDPEHNMSRSYFYEVLLPIGATPAMATLGACRETLGGGVR